MLSLPPSYDDILEAAEKIDRYIHKTPLHKSRLINEIAGCEITFKCENFQRAGAFKFRGAMNAVLSLENSIESKGVATHSSGNHAAALALAASIKGIPAYIVMPENAPEVKKKAVRSYGGQITFCAPNLKAREEALKKIVRETGAVFIHPYNNYDIIAGQATSALEVFQEIDDADYIIAPIGGGGLLSGTALSASYIKDNVKLIGAEPKGADDAYRSLRDNTIYPSENPKTIADGLLTSLGDKTFGIIKDKVSEIITVGEEEIITAMRLIWERMKIIVEPSSAVPLAVILKEPDKFASKKIIVIISGGNADLDNLPWMK